MVTTLKTGNNAKHSVLCHSYHSSYPYHKHYQGRRARASPCTRENWRCESHECWVAREQNGVYGKTNDATENEWHPPQKTSDTTQNEWHHTKRRTRKKTNKTEKQGTTRKNKEQHGKTKLQNTSVVSFFFVALLVFFSVALLVFSFRV